MKTITTNENRKTIIYFVPRISTLSNAVSENCARRKNILENCGFTVTLVEQGNLPFFSLLRLLWSQRLSIRGIIIRTDGTCSHDKYTLLKLAMPRIPFIWEMHGFPEEALVIADNVSRRLTVWKNSMKRTLFSYLVDACIFISDELYEFARSKIHIRLAATIPNFTSTLLVDNNKISNHLLSVLRKRAKCVVLWGGSADLPWQALDVVQKTADAVYRRNKHVVFLLVGSRFWFPMRSKKNILLLHPVDNEQFLELISLADVCLALYHKPKNFPFYFFPMKILDYMSMGKPVIASHMGMTPTLIQSGYNGFLTDNSVRDICDKILLLINDTALSQKLSRNARKTVMEKYSIAVAQKKYRDLFRSLSLC